MKILRLLALTVVMATLAIAASAQQGMRRGGGNYNPSTEATLTGTVTAVTNVPSSGRGGGLHFTLTVPSGPIEVHVGPASFVASKNFTIAKGDGLTVVGSKVTMAAQDVVIAREIKKGDQVLTLRDANGFPAWSARSENQPSGQESTGMPQHAHAAGPCICCEGHADMQGMARHATHGGLPLPQ